MQSSFPDQVHPLILHRWHRFLGKAHRARIALLSKGLRQSLSRAMSGLRSSRPRQRTAVDGQTVGTGRPGRPQLLFIDATTPSPDRDSGSLRLFTLMRRLVDCGYAVDFLPDDNRPAGRYTGDLTAAGIGVIGGPGVPSPASWLWENLRENQRRYDAVVVCRYHLARAWFPLLRQLPERPRLVLDTVDLHHVRELREAEVRGNRALARAAQRTRKWELAAVRDADTVWVVSPVERQALRDQMPGSSVEVIPNLHESKATISPHATRTGVLFVGSGRHPPNQDAVDWFVRDILPLVRRKLDGCQAHIVGEGLVATDAGDDGLVVHGHVEDMTPLLEGCLIGIAPLRYGAGVKGKINQYMAHGMPVVATTCATEGMQLRDGFDVLEADTAQAYADAIIRLHDDPALWQRLSTGGGINIDTHFSFESSLPAIHRTFGAPAAART